MNRQISVKEVIGGGYNDYWNTKKRYRCCKGSRGSKKSKTTALYYIVKMMQYAAANLLVVRRTGRTLKDSCYADLKWAIHRLGVDAFFNCTVSPLEITSISPLYVSVTKRQSPSISFTFAVTCLPPFW